MDIIPPLSCATLGAATAISQCTRCSNRRIGISLRNRAVRQAAAYERARGCPKVLTLRSKKSDARVKSGKKSRAYRRKEEPIKAVPFGDTLAVARISPNSSPLKAWRDVATWR